MQKQVVLNFDHKCQQSTWIRSPKKTWSSRAPMPEEFTDWETPVVVAWPIGCNQRRLELFCNGNTTALELLRLFNDSRC